MLHVAFALALVSGPIVAIIWFRWRVDRQRQNIKDASVRAMVDATLDQARVDREKSSIPKES